MADWAEKAAQIAAERDRERVLNLERSKRETDVRDAIGPKLFSALESWIGNQIKRFNEIRKNDELTITAKAEPGITNKVDRLLLIDGKNVSPLRVEYSSALHTITYECGSSARREFKLVVDQSGQDGWFESSYHQRITMEDLGLEMLTKWFDSPF
jgi:hypothetical protein